MHRLLSRLDRLTAITALFFIVLVSSQFYGIARPFFTRGEAREALAAQAMVAEGSWVLPRVYDGRVPSKPPFTHWMMAASAEVLSRGELTEAAARLPAVIASLMFVVLFYRWIRARFGSRAMALCSVMILCTTIEWARAAVSSRVDMVFSVALATASLAVMDLAAKRGRFSGVILFIALTVAFLSKGPVAWVLVGGFVGLLALINRDGTILLRSVAPAVGSLLVPLIWYYLAWTLGGDLFVQTVMSENFQRFAGTMEEQPHVHGVFYLTGTLILGLLPWIIAFIRAPKEIVAIYVQADAERRRILKYSAIFTLLVFIFFCIPASKRSVYLLPIYPGIALLLGYYLTHVRTKLLGFRIVSLLLGVVGLCISSGVVRFFAGKNREFVEVVLTGFSTFEIAAWATLGIFLILWALKDWELFSFALLLLSVIGLVNGSLLPRVATLLSPRNFSEELFRVGFPVGGIQSFERDAYGVAYYSRHHVEDFKKCQKQVGYIVPVKLLDSFERLCGPIVESFRTPGGVVKPGDNWAFVTLVGEEEK